MNKMAAYLNVEVLAEGGVVDGGVVHNAQPVPLATLAGPDLAGPCLHHHDTLHAFFLNLFCFCYILTVSFCILSKKLRMTEKILTQ